MDGDEVEMSAGLSVTVALSISVAFLALFACGLADQDIFERQSTVDRFAELENRKNCDSCARERERARQTLFTKQNRRTSLD